MTQLVSYFVQDIAVILLVTNIPIKKLIIRIFKCVKHIDLIGGMISCDTSFFPIPAENWVRLIFTSSAIQQTVVDNEIISLHNHKVDPYIHDNP